MLDLVSNCHNLTLVLRYRPTARRGPAAKEMMRRCSNCSHSGHNKRTCSDDGGPMLFGVRLIESSIRISSSAVGSLFTTSPSRRKSSCSLGSSSESSGGLSPAIESAVPDMAQRSSSSPTERKKATPWTEEEHRRFLVGLEELGRSAWRGISEKYVTSRTPTQVASHAQKYFKRQANMGRRRRRPSVFDVVAAETQPENPEAEAETAEEQLRSIDSTKLVVGEANQQKPLTTLCKYPLPIPSYVIQLVQSPIVIWPSYTLGTSCQPHEVASTSSHFGAAAIHLPTKPSYGGTSVQLGSVTDTSMKQVLKVIKPTTLLHAKSPIVLMKPWASNLNKGSSNRGATSQLSLLDFTEGS